MKNIASKALRVDAHQRRSGLNVSHDQGDGFFDAAVSIRAVFGAKTIDAEFAPAGREIRRRNRFECD
jgi:hypothetical protein